MTMTHTTSTTLSSEERTVTYAQAIDDAEIFVKLFGVISEHGAIEGSSREYSAGELISRISMIKMLGEDGYDAVPSDFRRVTRSLGLRYKCKELYAEMTADKITDQKS